MTRLEYYLRQKKNKLSMTDLFIIDKFQKDDHPVINTYDYEWIYYLMKNKNINIPVLAECYWQLSNDKKFNAVAHYNNYVKKVTDCLSLSMFERIEMYMRGLVDGTEIQI